MKLILPRLLNYILYAVGILIAGTGLLLRWKIPHGQAGHHVSLWGLDKHDWKDLHLWGGLALVLLVAWHLWLHRKWIMTVACQKHFPKLLAGLLAPIILLGALAITPLGQLQEANRDGRDGRDGLCDQCGQLQEKKHRRDSKAGKGRGERRRAPASKSPSKTLKRNSIPSSHQSNSKPQQNIPHSYG